MSKNAATDEAKKRARELVAQVKKRVARQEGAPAPEEAVADETESTETVNRENEAEAMQAKSAQAKGVRKQHSLAKSHVTRAQGHAAARTQRSQGRGDSK